MRPCILDRYIEGTTLRLRRLEDQEGHAIFKLTQKLPERTFPAQQGRITNLYLTAAEHEVLAPLPAKTLRKIRYSVPPFGIDVFEETLKGLILAEAEFDSAAEASALAVPSFVVKKVSEDVRFTEGRLIAAAKEDLQNWLAEYGIRLNPIESV
jgi:CYTH domain-containing protein